MIGIVVLNYNDYENTISFLNQITNYEIINHICIVDNASTDESLHFLNCYQSEKVTIIKSKENAGYGAGNNIGIKFLIDKKNCNYIFISNPDIEISNEVITKMIQIIQKNEDIAILGPTIQENGEFNRGWKLPTLLDDILANLPFISKKVQKRIKYSSNYHLEALSRVDVVSGCFFLAKASVLKEINYFDEHIFLYYEENVLGKKLQKINYHSYVCNQLYAIHHHSISIDKSIKHLNKIKILKRSQRYYQKYYNNANAFGMFGLYLTYYIYIFLFYVVYLIKKVVRIQ